MTFLKKNRGFTLIELLVVISVIALIAAMVFNSLRGARESARISNALSFQHQMHSLLGADLVGWWNFDNEPVSNQFRDLSGGGNTGTCTGVACPTPVDGVPGTRGTAMSFDGVDDVVIVPHSASLNITGAITVGAWIRRNVVDRRDDIITKVAGGYNVHIQSNANLNRVFFQAHDSGGTFRAVFSNPNAVVNTEWHHVAVSYERPTARFYVNGQPWGTAVRDFDMRPTSGELLIGVFSTFFSGSIDDVRIYSRALTASEIQTLYAQTRDKYLVEEK